MPKVIGQQDFQKIPVKGLVAETASSAPSSPVGGQFWFDSANNKLKINNTGTFLDFLDRANHSGTQLAATISDFNTAVRTNRLDQMAAPTAAVNFNSQRLTAVSDPTSATDAANKQYVDNARAGLAVKDPVRVALTSNVNLAAPGATLDGVTMVANDRFLVAGQTTGTQNGIYIWNGAAAAATRSTDDDATGEVVDGTLVAVAEGTDAGSQYIQTATPSGAPGAWTQTWTKYSAGGQTYTADGQGIELSGTTFSIELADGTLAKSGTGLTVGLVTVAKGGTNATTAAGARTNLGATGKYAADLGTVTAGTPVTVTHNLGNQDVVVSLRETAGGAVVLADIIVVDNNNITVTSQVAYATGALRVVVVG